MTECTLNALAFLFHNCSHGRNSFSAVCYQIKTCVKLFIAFMGLQTSFLGSYLLSNIDAKNNGKFVKQNVKKSKNKTLIFVDFDSLMTKKTV